MLKKIATIGLAIMILLSGSLYRPQKTEAFGLVLTGMAIAGLLAIAGGFVIYQATSENDYASVYDFLDQTKKDLLGEVVTETSDDGDKIKLKSGAIQDIASSILMGLYNTYDKWFGKETYGNPVSNTKPQPHDTKVNAEPFLGFVPVGVVTKPMITIANKWAMHDGAYLKYGKVPKDSNKNSVSYNLTTTDGTFRTTVGYFPGSLFGFPTEALVTATIFNWSERYNTTAPTFRTDLDPHVYVINDRTAAIAWGSGSTPIYKEDTINDLVPDINNSIQTVVLPVDLPVLGSWEPGLELDPVTARDLVNDTYNGIGNDYIELGGGIAVANEAWNTLTPSLVNPTWELDPTMPWDTWDDITLPVIDADVISGVDTMPGTGDLDVGLDISWRGWLVGGLLGLGNLLKNALSWLLGGLAALLTSIFQLVKLGFENIFSLLNSLLESITGVLSGILAYLSTMLASLSGSLDNIWESIKGIPNFFSGINQLLAFMMKLFSYILNFFKALIDLIAIQLFGNIINGVAGVIASIKAIFSVLPDPLDEVSYRIINIMSFTALLSFVLKVLRLRKA